jgi:hypothetical protein
MPILILVKIKIKILSTLLLAMKVLALYQNYKNVYSNPEPPVFVLREFSTLNVRSNIRSCSSGIMPIPSSAISDEGIGIIPELQERIFERTFRVENSRNTKTGGRYFVARVH